ncbi:Hsp20/alpha crystallin family protein [Dissulfurirhabdus thermomarina]|uniref:Hsp20/alpha crystallin family protein n=1 Tax=Dissulfurirhabdus thermomarina TaxID=1765737 RepID=A0A6N9TT04_DISTH|nr:Hsp20/alpha crystallin family protein [Dissulfurirhabdus thermomarina]NDY42874.1 Hsp20/alpha crystallin family protein [Dissulfurirhabdus thermomarina]NMX24431.1 Hsp20/alpha crystallin family protein [Dissulfurirhabdus thermomarina]
MPIIKIKIGRNIGELTDSLHRMAGTLLRYGNPVVFFGQGWSPSVDVYREGETVYVVAALAGVAREDVQVTLEAPYLRIAGVRRPPPQKESRHFYQMEVEYGPFERMVRLPSYIDENKVEAVFDNGLLTVRLERRKPEAPTKITVTG